MIIQGKIKGQPIRIGMTCERIDVTTLSERDPNWKYIDRQGHEHTWHKPRGTEDWSQAHFWTLPTLRAVSYICNHSDDGDPIFCTHYYCKKCGEQVRPGKRSPMFTRFVSGAKQYYVNDVPVDKKTVTRVLEELEASLWMKRVGIFGSG